MIESWLIPAGGCTPLQQERGRKRNPTLGVVKALRRLVPTRVAAR